MRPDLIRSNVGIVKEILEPRDRILQREVSVIIPAYDEAAHVASQIREVRDVMENSGWRYEIIVVDDGSTDGTGEQAAQADTGASVLRHRRNRGYGTALKSGFMHPATTGSLSLTRTGLIPPQRSRSFSPQRTEPTWLSGLERGLRFGSLSREGLPNPFFAGWRAIWLAPTCPTSIPVSA